MKQRKALVIDDEQIVLDSVGKILRDEGWTVDTSLSGRNGLEMARGGPFDVVLTDIRMPDMGGMRVLREVKRARPVQPVVMITGFATVQSAVQAMKLGADDYLEKPFTPEQLLESMARALDRAGSRPPEPQELVHRKEIIEVLERAAADGSFVTDLLYRGADALDSYDLTAPEKLAILTGDMSWIEEHVGKLTSEQRKWLEQRLSAEIW